ncbi:MAG TPA: DUF5655 domain-containing protein [Gemmatimonadales bacterium]|nr:DUF5655 domain-containing protein [Gemmatimonadales bacterium]
MTSPRPLAAVAAHFRDKAPNVAATYAALLGAARRLGPVQEDPKKTSIHLVRETAFAGIATQKKALILTLKSASDLQSPRIRRREQASANRWHLELKLSGPEEVDAELVGWLAAAYGLAGK